MGIEFNDAGLKKKLSALRKDLKHSARVGTARAADVLKENIDRNLHVAPRRYRVYVGGVALWRNPGELHRVIRSVYLPQNERRGTLSAHKVRFNRSHFNGIGRVAHLIEGGTKPHVIVGAHGTSWRHKGAPHYPFMQKSLASSRSAIVEAVGSAIRESFDGANK